MEFQSNYPWLQDTLLSFPGASRDFKVEWQWERYLLGTKMFAALCEDGTGAPVVSLKCDPAMGEPVSYTHLV